VKDIAKKQKRKFNRAGGVDDMDFSRLHRP
jgi:hypothetical protein